LTLYRTFYILAGAMGARPATARTQLLDAAEEMLREAGMCGAGIKDVVARSGTPIGSLYHYFPGGKTQLVAESLRRHAGKVPLLLERHFDGKTSAAAALRNLFDGAAAGFERGGAVKACAIGAVTLDVLPSDTQIRTVCNDALQHWVRLIADRLPFSSERARTSFAVLVVAALEGAFILAKASGSGDPFRQAGAQLAAALPLEARRRSPRGQRRQLRKGGGR
jgi:TetR/AcrR family transcriptional repressor of lmrAB and yxaGH operons